MEELSSKRVLIVEDEIMIAMLIEEMLIDLGHKIVGHARTAQEAWEIIEHGSIDGAILDVNLGGQTRSTPVARTLKKLQIPFIFVTGYGSSGSPDEFRDHSVLKKPFSSPEFEAKIVALFA